MVCFGAVMVADLSQTFYGQTRPISDQFIPEALAVSGFTREQHMEFRDPEHVMAEFADWLQQVSHGTPTIISDNIVFDGQFMNYYFHHFFGGNPFGFSGRRIGDLYCGMKMDAGKNAEWKKKYRETKHTHHPVDDAMGNAEALIAMRDDLGLKISY